jgi:hypothetical protein
MNATITAPRPAPGMRFRGWLWAVGAGAMLAVGLAAGSVIDFKGSESSAPPATIVRPAFAPDSTITYYLVASEEQRDLVIAGENSAANEAESAGAAFDYRYEVLFVSTPEQEAEALRLVAAALSESGTKVFVNDVRTW